MSDSPHRQALRLRLPPPELAALIDLVNCIPPTRELPDVLEKLAAANVCATEYGLKFKAALERALPRSVCPLFWELFGPYFPSRWLEAVKLYVNLTAARSLLRALAKTSAVPGEFELPPVGSGTLIGAEITKDGNLQFVLGTVLKILEGVEVARIRLCPMCRVVYWAGRITKPGCSPKCINALRQQRWRRRYPKRYKQQRYRRSERVAKAGLRANFREKPRVTGLRSGCVDGYVGFSGRLAARKCPIQ